LKKRSFKKKLFFWSVKTGILINIVAALLVIIKSLIGMSNDKFVE